MKKVTFRYRKGVISKYLHGSYALITSYQWHHWRGLSSIILLTVTGQRYHFKELRSLICNVSFFIAKSDHQADLILLYITLVSIFGMKLLCRRILTLGKQGYADDPCVEIVTSMYRPFVDGGYRNMISTMVTAGEFDAFIGALLQGLLSQGNF